MRKLGYIAIVLLAGLSVISCQKEEFGPAAETVAIPEWEDTMNRGSEDFDFEDQGNATPDDDMEGIDTEGIVDPNNDGDGREN